MEAALHLIISMSLVVAVVVGTNSQEHLIVPSSHHGVVGVEQEEEAVEEVLVEIMVGMVADQPNNPLILEQQMLQDTETEVGTLQGSLGQAEEAQAVRV